MTSRNKLVKILTKASKLLDRVGHILSDKERDYIQESLDLKSISTPKLLIKDNKKSVENGTFPTRLIAPATNVTSNLPKIDYIGIKEIFKIEKINYVDKTIIQASILKEQIEKLNLKKENTTIISLNIVSMYPSISFRMVEKAVRHYAKTLNKKQKRTIKVCLKMIKFGMDHSLLTLVDK